MFHDITAPYHFLESWLYDSAVAPAVAEMIGERPAFFRKVLDAMPAEGSLLDVGCGGGHLLLDLARAHPGWRLTGLDLSADQVRRAGKRARELAGRITFITGSAQDLPFPDASFDAVVSVCSIKHWPDALRGLSECLRVLRPGGVLVVAEVEREYDRRDRRAFIARQRVPLVLKPVACFGFAWKVAARSITIREAVALFDSLPVTGIDASPVPGMPLWLVSAVKCARDQRREKSRVAK